MRIGNPEWQLVSLDTAGVPHGGPFGRVGDFVEQAKKRSLYVAWSRLWKCFVIYTKMRRKVVFQMLCRKPGSGAPIALGRGFLWYLCYLRDHFCRLGDKNLMEANNSIVEAQREIRRKASEAARDEIYPMRNDIIRATALRRGQRGPRVMSMPKGKVRLWHGRHTP